MTTQFFIYFKFILFKFTFSLWCMYSSDWSTWMTHANLVHVIFNRNHLYQIYPCQSYPTNKMMTTQIFIYFKFILFKFTFSLWWRLFIWLVEMNGKIDMCNWTKRKFGGSKKFGGMFEVSHWYTLWLGPDFYYTKLEKVLIV